MGSPSFARKHRALRSTSGKLTLPILPFGVVAYALTFLKELSHGILSYFGHIQNNKNNSLIREKNTKEIKINHKGTRMAKNGEDYHGLQTTNLKD